MDAQVATDLAGHASLFSRKKLIIGLGVAALGAGAALYLVRSMGKEAESDTQPRPHPPPSHGIKDAQLTFDSLDDSRIIPRMDPNEEGPIKEGKIYLSLPSSVQIYVIADSTELDRGIRPFLASLDRSKHKV